MAETDIIFDDEDERALIQFMLDQGLSVVPGIFFPTKDYWELRDVDRVMKTSRRQTHQPSFLIRPDFLIEPLQMGYVEDKGFSVSPREGGPALDWLTCKLYDGGIGSGFVAYYPTYWTAGFRESYPAPKPLVDTYRSIVRFIKGMSVRMAVLPDPKRVWWVGKGTLERNKPAVLAYLPGLQVCESNRKRTQ